MGLQMRQGGPLDQGRQRPVNAIGHSKPRSSRRRALLRNANSKSYPQASLRPDNWRNGEPQALADASCCIPPAQSNFLQTPGAPWIQAIDGSLVGLPQEASLSAAPAPILSNPHSEERPVEAQNDGDSNQVGQVWRREFLESEIHSCFLVI